MSRPHRVAPDQPITYVDRPKNSAVDYPEHLDTDTSGTVRRWRVWWPVLTVALFVLAIGDLGAGNAAILALVCAPATALVGLLLAAFTGEG